MHKSPVCGSSSSSDNSNSEIPTPIKMGSLRDVYECSEEEETNLFCLYADHEPLTFQEAVEKSILFRRMTHGSYRNSHQRGKRLVSSELQMAVLLNTRQGL
jgi:hypothetical protein